MKYYSAIGSDGREVLVDTQAEAKAINKDFTVVEVPSEKTALRELLQGLLDAAQSSQIPLVSDEWATAIITAPKLSAESSKPSYSDWSLKIEDEWAQLPISMQLHFAELALNEVRRRIPKEPTNEGQPDS